MATLNREPARVLSAFDVHALTDVTGFGLLGHLRNITAASAVSATVWLDRVPALAAARAYVEAGIAPGGTHANRRFLRDWVDFEPAITDADQLLLCDAQTSGGLLATLPAAQAASAVQRLQAAGVGAAAIIGRIESGEPGKIRVNVNP